jgi:hypothetical protein
MRSSNFSAVRLDAHLLDAAVAREGGRAAAEAGVLDAQPVHRLRPRFLQTRAQRTPRRAVGRDRRHRAHAPRHRAHRRRRRT